ncbi:MAG: 30S ribosomal protein S8 [bacterium]|nr:30S ribosomal protein S8 [bacterium]
MMDPISDMLIRIKNAQNAGHEMVRFSHSKFKYEIARALEANGYVGKIERKGKRVKKILEIELQYNKDKKPAINGITLISKPSNRLYAGVKELNTGRKGGIILISTPKGVMSGRDARKQKVGGMLIAEVW